MGGFFVQSSHGAKGNFELVVPRTGGGLAHWFRKNDDPRRALGRADADARRHR